MVHPYLRSGTGSADEVVARVTGLLERLHAIVVGPGLGRDPLMQECARRILEEAKRKEMPVVVDAVSWVVCVCWG